MAAGAIPLVGSYSTFWISLVLVCCGGALALLGAREVHGSKPIADLSAGRPSLLGQLGTSVAVAWRYPKVGGAALCRVINTGAQYGFFVALPFFLTTQQIGFSQTQYLLISVITFGANVIANPINGRLSDRYGWRRSIQWIGGVGCACTTLLLYFVPLAVQDDFALVAVAGAPYGITLAGFVPLSALMPSMVDEDLQGNALSLYALSVVLGPLVYTALYPLIGILGVMVTFSALYVVSAVVAHFVRDPVDPGEPGTREGSAAVAH